MWAKPSNIEQHTERLLRVVEPDIFRFVLVQAMPQTSVAELLAEVFRKKFPARPLHRIRIENQSATQLLREIEQAKNGFVLLENLENLFKNPDFAASFNQRRDRIAARPIALLAFLPTGPAALREAQDGLPDFWSFRADVLEIKCRLVPDLYPVFEPEFREPVFELTLAEKEREIERLQNRLASTSPAEAYLHASGQVQLAGLFADLCRWPEGFAAVETALAAAQTLPQDASTGDLQFAALHLQSTMLKDKEDFDGAAAAAIEAFRLAEELMDLEKTVKAMSLLGWAKVKAGDAEGGKAEFEKSLQFAEQVLPEGHIERVRSKAYLGIALRKMGEVDAALRVLEEARAGLADGTWDHLVVSAHWADSLVRQKTSHENEIRLRVSFGILPTFHEGIRYLCQASFWSNVTFSSEKTNIFFAKSHLEKIYGKDHPIWAEVLLTESITDANEREDIGLPFHAGSIFEKKLAKLAQNVVPKALAQLSEAAQIFEKFYPPQSLKHLEVAFVKIRILTDYHLWRDAEPLLKNLIGKLEAKKNPHPMMLRECYTSLSIASGKLRHREQAAESAEKAGQIFVQLLDMPLLDSREIWRLERRIKTWDDIPRWKLLWLKLRGHWRQGF